MKRLSKLLCSSIGSLVNCPCRYESGSIKDAGGKWAERLEAKEGEYFWRKNKEYMEYIKQELKKGRTMQDLIEEHKKHLNDLHDHKHVAGNTGEISQKWTMGVDDKSAPDLQKDTQYADYIKKEVQKGRPLEEVIQEIKEKIKKKSKSH